MENHLGNEFWVAQGIGLRRNGRPRLCPASGVVGGVADRGGRTARATHFFPSPHASGGEGKGLKFKLRCWMFIIIPLSGGARGGCRVEGSTFNVGCSMLDVQCWMFDVRCLSPFLPI